MKKIFGILLALSLVLSLAMIATPVAAKVTVVNVTVVPDCACTIAQYTITFNTSASLTEGVHCVCVKFPAGTGVPTTYKDGDITINTDPVFGSEVTVSGTEVCFLPPDNYSGGAHTVIFTAAADIVNPCEPGKYQLEVYTCREPDSAPVKSNKYEIVPCICEFGFTWDSGPTYPGIAEGFVPPFKACGQNMSDPYQLGNITHPKWANAFNLTFEAGKGCNSPCQGNVTLWMSLVAAPQFPCEVDPTAYVTINLTAPCGGVNWTKLSFNECVDDEPTDVKIGWIDGPACNESCVFEGYIHFDTVGEYTICFWAECPGAVGAPCQPPAGGDAQKFAETCLDFKVHQWKYADYILLWEKWNLISLDLVPLEENIPIEDALASIPKADRDLIQSIWYYDRCEDEWLVWGNGQDSLKTLEDGKAYWVRVDYPIPNCGPITWWIWGNPMPVPPASPAEYAVCEGWNMLGYTNYWFQVAPAAYLWNWAAAPFPVVYEWVPGCWTSQGWQLVNFNTGTMLWGRGYWVAFPADGSVYPK